MKNGLENLEEKNHVRENVQGERNKDEIEMPKMNQQMIILRLFYFVCFIKSQWLTRI